MTDPTSPAASVPASLGEMGLDSFAPYLMNRIMARYNGSLREEMTKLGLTTPKMRVLAVLTVVDAPLIGELAVFSVIENSTLSRTLDALEADGLVQRRADADDSRATRIIVTDAGRRCFATIWPSMMDSYEHMFRDIDPSERAAFIATLGKMLRNVRVHDY